MRRYLRLFFLLILFLAGCAPHQKHVLKDKAVAFIHPLPAVFRADLILKRCPPTSFELVLRPDGLYFLQMRKSIPGNAAVQAEIGVWRYNEKKKIVQLTGYDKAVRILAVTGKKVLKLIKVSGGIMPPFVRYDFTLTDTEPTYEGVIRMQGMYSRKRGRGVFRECLSGVSFPLLNKSRAAEAEQAYRDILHGRPESLLVTLDVRLSSRSGRGDRLIPVRSVNIDLYRSCNGKERRIATITDNRWYLIEVGGKTPERESLSKPPFLKVQSGEQLIQGFAGCNNFTGSWLFTDNEFVFSRIAATRMACTVGMELEDDFLQALDNTRRYTIRGDILSLHDRRGKVLARLRYSRQLTDLDFTLSPAQEGTGEGSLADESVPESHRVEAEGAVPASVAIPSVEEASREKIQPKPSSSRKVHTGGHKIRVLKANKKIAVSAAAQPDILLGTAKHVSSAPKASVPTAVNERQDGKAEKQQAPVDNTEQAGLQSNQAEEAAPSLPPIPEAENEEQEIQSSPLAVEQGNAVPAPESENKMVQSEARGDVVEKNNSSTTSFPERENNVLSLPREGL
jgi:heat shock protein HslJ